MRQNTIGLTSKGSAAARTHESKRPDALFVDLFAPIYASQADDISSENTSHIEHGPIVVGREGASCCSKISCRRIIANLALRSAWFMPIGTARLIGINVRKIFEDVAVRTRFLDDIIQNSIMSTQQIGVLACGGDFRPYRLASLCSSSDMAFYLLDLPSVITYRQKCFTQLEIPPTTPWRVIEVPCNLVDDNWSRQLREAGFDINKPTLWIAEGFFEYLTEQQIRLLFNQIRKLSSSNQTYIAFDLVSSRFQTSFRRYIAGGLFQFTVDDKNEIHRICSELGCSDIQCTSFQEIGSKYSRNVSRDRSFIVNAKIHPFET